MAPPLSGWDELPADILTSVVVDRLHTLKSYLAARGVCRAWRAALPPEPPRPCLVTLPQGSRFIGSCHGWVAVAYKPRNESKGFYFLENKKKPYSYKNFQGEQIQVNSGEVAKLQNPRKQNSFMALLNPINGRRVDLPEHDRLDPWTVSKVVFAPNPRKDDFTVVVGFGWNSLAYISTRDDGAWSFGEIHGDTTLADMVYRVDDDGGGDRVYCLARSGDVHVLHLPRGRPTNPVIEPLLPELAHNDHRVFNPADVFPAPHDKLSCLLLLEESKRLAFFGGHLYQVWRSRTGGDIRVKLPGGGGFLTVHKDEVVVLMYDSSCRPCWKVVGDLGGHAVFVGPRNSAPLVLAEGMPGLKGDCVYWLGRYGKRTTKVFDMRTRMCTRCFPPFFDVGVPVRWYSLGGDAGSSNGKHGETSSCNRKRKRIVDQEPIARAIGQGKDAWAFFYLNSMLK